MRSAGLTIALAVAVAACSSPFDPSEVRSLANARAQWSQREFADYSFEARHDCFCTPEMVGPVRVTVRQGAIASVTLLETGAAVDPAHWFTIEQLFERIPLWAKNDGVDDVTVNYDAILGFPSSVQVRYQEDHLDAGDTYTVSAVAPA
jgi:Family of unknown function (DUF6174)